MRILLLVLMLTAAAPPSPDDLVREADAAFDRGDDALAESLYARAAERSTDPGLIAFNRGIVLMRSGQLVEAERAFRRSLDDAAAPESRRARAWFNLGNCLVERPPADDARLRTAIECYRRCLDLTPEEPLRGWAINNLEVAKLRWAAREKQPEGDTPNNEPRELAQLPDRQPKKNREGEADPMGKGDPSKTEKSKVAPSKGSETKKSDAKPEPAAGQLPVLPDTDAVAPLTTEEATKYLRESAERLKRERRNLSRAATRGGQADVRNW